MMKRCGNLRAVRRFAYLALGLLVTPCAAALERGETALEACHLDAPGMIGRPEAFCARIEVPEDHAAAGGRRITLRVAVLPAVRRDRRPDPLVLLAGGPGQASTEAFIPLLPAFERIHRQRDLVLIDQRGTGRLSPLSCEEVEDTGYDLDTGVALSALRQCLEAIGDAADPSLYTTAASVRDLDMVRRRLGYDAINLYGISYGTRLAQLYARHHPESVRSMVLDGVVPLDLVLGENLGADAQRALDALFDRCRQDPRCDAELPDLGRRLDAFLDQLERQPMVVTVNHPRTGEPVELALSRQIAAMILRMLIYSPESAALVPLLVDRAAGGDVERFAAQWLTVAEGLGTSINAAMSMSISCGEDVAFLDPAAVAAAASSGFLRDDVPKHLRRVCEVWPHRQVPAEEKTPLRSAVPALLLSGENDPVTPPAYGEQLLATLARARHIVVPGMGHNVLGRGCMPRLVADFVASADPQAVDPECAAKVEPLDLFLSFTGLLASSDEGSEGGG